MHYLLVDDDKTFSQILSRALKRRGFTTTLAHNADDAIKLSQDNEFNRAIIDLKMEGASGLTVISHLKQQQPTSHTKRMNGNPKRVENELPSNQKYGHQSECDQSRAHGDRQPF